MYILVFRAHTRSLDTDYAAMAAQAHGQQRWYRSW